MSLIKNTECIILECALEWQKPLPTISMAHFFDMLIALIKKKILEGYKHTYIQVSSQQMSTV